ncbi:hypothetical protein D9M73_114180 [compost metagenome]
MRRRLSIRRQRLFDRSDHCVDAVKINPGGEQVAVARERQGGQITAPAPTPNPDPRRINIGPCRQPFACGQHIAIFRGTTPRLAGCFAKIVTVTGAAAIVDRQHVIALGREMLVQDVGV